MIKEVSAGGVVYRKRDGKLEIQLIHDRYGKITLAKGKREQGETIEQTALREIEEETGIRGRIIAPLETIYYQYHLPDHGDVNKEVHYYLVEAQDGHLEAQLEEIRDVGWYEPKAAWQEQRRYGYDNNDSVLRKAFAQLGLDIEEDQ